MAQKAPNLRPHNLQHIQPGTTDYAPKNDGYEKEIVDQSDNIKIGVQDGKTGSVESANVTTYARSHG